MKLLLYCTKVKPYLNCDFGKDNHEEYSGDWNIYLANKQDECSNIVNGKIVAECDFEVEEIKYEPLIVDSKIYYYYEPETMFENKFYEKSCLTNEQLKDYLGDKNGYAIHIKNLHIFDKPKELSEYYSQGQVDWIEETELYRLKNGITTAPQNMCYAYKYNYSKGKLEEYILISIRPEWLCKILNKEKTIEVRKKVLKEMLK